MKKIKLVPSPGILIAELISSTETNSLILTSKSDSHLLKGKVIAIGDDLITDNNALLEKSKYGHVGDVIYFLSYEGNYDNAIIDDDKYYMVKWQDIRCVVKY